MDDITAPRPFEEDEQSSLSTLLKSQLNLHNVSCPFQAEADAEDLVKYIFEMVDDGENVGHVINEVRDLGLDEICSEDNLANIRDQLAEFLVSMEGRGWKNKWSVMSDNEKEGSDGALNEERIDAVPPPHTRRVTQEETPHSPRSVAPQPVRQLSYAEEIQAREKARGEEIVKNSASMQAKIGGSRAGQPGASATVESNGRGYKMSYAEEIQARERARGEEIVKNSASMQAKLQSRSGQLDNATIESNGLGYSGASGKKQMSYAEQIQARERARGEELIKNSAQMQAKLQSRSGQLDNATVESNGLGYSGASGKKQMSYAEEIQARERARGEELIKNSALMQAKLQSRSGQLDNATVESHGLGYSGASGKKQMSYAEEIQAREKARGEEIVRNNASTQAFAERMSLHQYSSSSMSDETPHDSDYDSPNHVDVDLSQTCVDADMKKDLDAMRREELKALMKDRSLNKEEKAQKMKEIREKYAGLV